MNDANDGSTNCIEAPEGVQPPSDQPTEEGVQLITETALSFEGGKTAFDTTDKKAKFEAAVVSAMASSPDGLIGVQCTVSAVAATGSGRRLGGLGQPCVSLESARLAWETQAPHF